MGKGIKKFNQEIRVVEGYVSIENSASTHLVSNNYGAYYVYSDSPYFANSSVTYKLANNVDVVAVSSQTWTNTSNIANNTTLINSAIESGITFSDGTISGIVGLGDTLIISGGSHIEVSYNSTNSAYTISTDATTNTNYYLSSATIDTSALITFKVTGASDVTLDLNDKISLDQLSGVSTTGAVDGNFLVYDSSTNTWVATGITEDNLIAGSGISFDTGTNGQVIINNTLYNTLSAGSWIASDGTNTESIAFNDQVTFTGGTDINVIYTPTTNTFTFNYTGTDPVYNGVSGITVNGTNIGHTNSYTITNTTTGLNVNDYTIDAYGHITTVTARDLTANLDARYVNVTGDTMTGDLTINAKLNVNGQTTITGDLYVSGTTVSVNTENLTVTDNIIVINSGQTGSGVSRGTAGIVVDRGLEQTYAFIFDENTDTFRIGETTSLPSSTSILTGDTQAVATRNDNMLNSSLTYWNGTSNRFDSVDSGHTLAQNDIAIYSGGSWVYYNATTLVSGEPQYSKILGGTSTTLTDPDFTNAKVVIIDYLIDGTIKQEGQLRYLVSDDTITNDYQGDLDLSFSDASISGTDLILTHDSSTETMLYYVKIIK